MLMLTRGVGQKIIINEVTVLTVTEIKQDHILITIENALRASKTQRRVYADSAAVVDHEVRMVYKMQSINQVRLGFEAPRHIVILREEVLLRSQQKRRAACA